MSCSASQSSSQSVSQSVSQCQSLSRTVRQSVSQSVELISQSVSHKVVVRLLFSRVNQSVGQSVCQRWRIQTLSWGAVSQSVAQASGLVSQAENRPYDQYTSCLIVLSVNQEVIMFTETNHFDKPIHLPSQVVPSPK